MKPIEGKEYLVKYSDRVFAAKYYGNSFYANQLFYDPKFIEWYLPIDSLKVEVKDKCVTSISIKQ